LSLTFRNVGHVFVDDENADRFRFQPVASEGVILPKSYKGTSGGGLWKFYLAQENFSLVQARLIGVAYWEKPVATNSTSSGMGRLASTRPYLTPFARNGLIDRQASDHHFARRTRVE
jgi:hypothetical protein